MIWWLYTVYSYWIITLICKYAKFLCGNLNKTVRGNEIHSNLKWTELIKENWASLVSVISLPPLEDAVNMNERLYWLLSPSLLCPAYLEICTVFFLSCQCHRVLTPARALSQACVCWLLAGFGLKEQLAVDVWTGSGGDMAESRLFPSLPFQVSNSHRSCCKFYQTGLPDDQVWGSGELPLPLLIALYI